MLPAVDQTTTRVSQPVAAGFGSSRLQLLLLNVLLIVASVAIYAPVRNYPFVNYDDPWYVAKNVHIQNGLTGDAIVWSLVERGYCHNWHPLTWMSHALDIQLFGLNAGAHHSVNVLLHIVAALLLFWMLRRATGSTGASFMVAALFAVHPINVESVAWISERKTMVSMIFFLLTFAAYDSYVRKPTNGRFWLVALCYLCGIMGKPQVIMLPVLLLLWDYWPLQRMKIGESASDMPVDDLPKRPFLQLLGEKVPLFVIGIGSAAITMVAQEVGPPAKWKYPLSVRIENAIFSYAKYVCKAFWPSQLSPFYPHPGNSLTALQVGGAFIFLLLITGLVYVARKHRYLVVGWLWFLIALVPMIGLIQVWEQGMADRYAYQSFVGLFLMVCWGVKECAAKFRVPASALTAVSAVVLVSLGVAARMQTKYWENSIAIWTRSLQVTPTNNFIGEQSLGWVLNVAGRKEEAMPHVAKALQMRPDDAISNLQLAVYEHGHGDLNAAVQHYKLVVTAQEVTIGQKRMAFENMARAYTALGDSEQARQALHQAEELPPDNDAPL